MSKINSILEILKDGKLHRITNLKMEININNFEMQNILAFLRKFEFIELVDNKQVRIKQNFERLIAQ